MHFATKAMSFHNINEKCHIKNWKANLLNWLFQVNFMWVAFRSKHTCMYIRCLDINNFKKSDTRPLTWFKFKWWLAFFQLYVTSSTNIINRQMLKYFLKHNEALLYLLWQAFIMYLITNVKSIKKLKLTTYVVLIKY